MVAHSVPMEGLGGNIWRLQAMVIYPLLLLFMTTNLRIMLKYFPWTHGLIIGYKMLRFLHQLLFTFTVILGKSAIEVRATLYQVMSPHVTS